MYFYPPPLDIVGTFSSQIPPDSSSFFSYATLSFLVHSSIFRKSTFIHRISNKLYYHQISSSVVGGFPVVWDVFIRVQPHCYTSQ
jgi:hypothetical protein